MKEHEFLASLYAAGMVFIGQWAGIADGLSDVLSSRLTLEFASKQIVLRTNTRSPFPPLNVRITPNLA